MTILRCVHWLHSVHISSYVCNYAYWLWSHFKCNNGCEMFRTFVTVGPITCYYFFFILCVMQSISQAHVISRIRFASIFYVLFVVFMHFFFFFSFSISFPFFIAIAPSIKRLKQIKYENGGINGSMSGNCCCEKYERSLILKSYY